MSERRKIKRFSFEIPAKIETTISDREGVKSKKFKLQTSNLSSSGAFFPTSDPLQKGTKVKVDMVLPLDRLKGLDNDFRHAYVEVTGKVSRCDPSGMAVCFDEDHQISPCRALPTGECVDEELPFERVAWDQRMLLHKDDDTSGPK